MPAKLNPLKFFTLTLALSATLIFSGIATRAEASDTQEASPAEKGLLCEAVVKKLEKLSEESPLDYSLIEKKCTDSYVQSTLFSEGARVLEGIFPFKGVTRGSFDLLCTAAYFGQPKLENLIDGLNSVKCEEIDEAAPQAY